MSPRAFVDVLSVAFVALGAPATGAAVSMAAAGGDTTMATGVSIVVTAVALRPLRRALRSLGARFLETQPEPFERLRAFASGLADLPPSEEQLPEVARLIAAATGASWASMSLRGSEVEPIEASWPDHAGGEASRERVSVVQGGQRLGAIAIGSSQGSDAPTLLNEVADVAAPFLRDLVLVRELEARVRRLDEQAAELREARRRIVAVSDRERRRLERNLHDGAQQQLTGLIFRLAVARDVAAKAPERLPAVLAELTVMAEDAVAAIVELSDAVGPRLLQEHGLAQALLMQVVHLPLAVDVAVNQLDRHPPEIEAAIYFSCLEALQNALRHADACHVRLELSESDEAVRFLVEDDGRGFDATPTPKTRGIGLQNLRDRLAALGGIVEVTSAPGQGTRVVGTVPLASRILASA